MHRFVRFFMVCILSVSAMAQVRLTKLHNRDVWQIENPQLRVTVTQAGGHIAEVVLKGKNEMNPLWVQARPTIEPTEYIPEKHEKLYGGGPGARLLSGLVGHNLCFPFWGDPSNSEYQSGMTFHGETGIVRWRKIAERQEGTTTQITIAADLPESRTRFTRTISLTAGEPVVYFDNRAENLSALDRPVGWCEHVTVGPPFLKKSVTLFDASLTRGRNLGDSSGQGFEWPAGQAETAVNLRTVRDVERSGFVNNFLVDPKTEFAYFTAVNPEQRLLFGYLFRRTEFPWLNLWEANQPATNDQPVMLTRGLEFSNTPTHGSFKAMVAVPKLWDVPAYEWLNARGNLVKKFCAFNAEVPAEFKGVQEIRIKDTALEIVERDKGRVVRIAFDISRLRY
jgi:hypothetical protein